MAAIQYASILNAWVSTEGFGGSMTNYIYYSVLVVTADGRRQIVEGKANEIQYLMPFVRTSQDELIQMREQLRQLEGSVKQLRQEIGTLADEKIDYVIRSLHPIPEVVGLGEREAMEKLEQAGFAVELENEYDAAVPHNGIVRACRRTADRFTAAVLDIIHPVPEILGLPEVQACGILEREGFRTRIRFEPSDEPNGTVVSVSRERETSMDLTVTLSRNLPAVSGMPLRQAKQILVGAGFTAREKPVARPDKPLGEVLGCTLGTEDPNLVELEYNVALDLNGLTEEEAVERLRGLNIPYHIQHVTCDEPEGKVFSFDLSNADQAKILVSRGAKRRKAASTTVKWQDMQGSLGDRYSADASYDQEKMELRLDVQYQIRTKNKHKVTYIRRRGKWSTGDPTLLSFPTMEEGTPGRMTIIIPAAQAPGSVTLALGTQYGLMKKDEEINLDFSITW